MWPWRIRAGLVGAIFIEKTTFPIIGQQRFPALTSSDVGLSASFVLKFLASGGVSHYRRLGTLLRLSEHFGHATRFPALRLSTLAGALQ